MVDFGYRDDSLFALMRRASDVYESELNECVGADAMTPFAPMSAAILLGLSRGTPRDSDATRYLMLTGSVLLDDLVARGYIELPPRGDGHHSIIVTDTGRAAAEKILATFREIDTELAAALSPEQLTGLRDGLDRLAYLGTERAIRDWPVAP